MTEECRHLHIRTWVGQGDGKPAGLWACAECGHKFVPLDIEREKDAERYRWMLSNVGPWHAWAVKKTGYKNLDSAIDDAMGAKPSDAQAFGTDLWSGIVA